MSAIKSFSQQGFYDLYDKSASSLFEALDFFQGYNKVVSILYLRMLRLPTLKGLVVWHWDENVQEKVLSIFNSWRHSSFLIRTDKKVETGEYMRGGYIRGVKDLDKEATAILNAGRIVILLEPRSPYDDLYSINAMFLPGEENISLEVVGPGFDASDLNRGDISPHETIYLPKRKPSMGYLLRASNINRNITDANTYKRSVHIRLAKIGRLLADRNGWLPPKLDVNISLEQKARYYLQETGKTLLLEHEKRYRSIPLRLLNKVHSRIADLPQKAQVLGIEGEPMVVSMSFFYPDNALAFWDIVWPSQKYSV